MNARLVSGLAGLIALALASGAAAAPPAGVLADAFARAQGHDALYRAALQDHASAAYELPLARAGLLPTVTLSASRTFTRGTRDSPGLFGETVRQDLDYRSPVAQLVVRAPLLNLEALMRYRQSKVQVAQSDDVLRIRRLELASRLGAALFERLLAHEQVGLAQRLLAAATEQRVLAERRLRGGEGTRIDVSDADAAVAVARAQLIDAQSQEAVAQRVLSQITGEDRAVLAVPVLPSPAPATTPATLPEWTALAMQSSPAVKARQQQLEFASLGVLRAKAGHAPRIDLVATALNSSNESLSTLNQDANLRTIGIQVSLPIFSGWAVQAATGRASALKERAAAELDSEAATVRLEVERQFLAVQSGAERIDALAVAVQASKTSLEGTRRALLAGLRTTADVLAAERQLFVAQRDLAQARFDYLLARLQLQAAAGVDADDIVVDLDRFLATPR